MLFPQPRPLPTVELLTQDAEPWRTDALRGRWHLLFFGFTSCPDICPTTLADMRRLLAELPPEQRANVQLVLVTADPARDSPAQLKDYLSYYRAGFQGLTGDLTQLQSLSARWACHSCQPARPAGTIASVTAETSPWWARTAGSMAICARPSSSTHYAEH